MEKILINVTFYVYATNFRKKRNWLVRLSLWNHLVQNIFWLISTLLQTLCSIFLTFEFSNLIEQFLGTLNRLIKSVGLYVLDKQL